MRFLVFSDAHGSIYHMIKSIDIHPETNAVIYLGDGTSEVSSLKKALGIPVYTVRGNCDFGSKEKITDFIEYKGHKIMICHGHYFNVKSGTYDLEISARENGCDIVLFGHTHIPYTHYRDGLYIMNPGTISQSPSPTYGILDITDGGVMTVIANAI